VKILMALALSLVLIPALGVAGVGPAQAQPLQASPVPIWGVVLGTVLVAGLIYLLVHSPDGGYYRYPYYGQYYQHYYRPTYRPYTGYYVASSPIVTVASALIGTVLGIIAVNNVQYILTRDADGHFYRYPYYGPYRQVYYRASYHPYRGSYGYAQVRQGDNRWDSDRRILAPASQRPPRQWEQQQAPRYQSQPRPNYQQQQRPNYQQQQRPGNQQQRQQQCGHNQEPACPDNGQQHP